MIKAWWLERRAETWVRMRHFKLNQAFIQRLIARQLLSTRSESLQVRVIDCTSRLLVLVLSLLKLVLRFLLVLLSLRSNVVSGYSLDLRSNSS